MNKTKTNAILLAVLAAIAAFLLTAAAFAAEPDGSHANSSAAVTPNAISESAIKSRRVIRVRCDRGHKLRRALRHARRGSKIKIWGTCAESVRITTDNVTMTGHNGAAIDGSGAASEAVVLVDGARNVTIENIAVQNGADQGLLFMRQAKGSVRGVTLTGNGTVGLAVDRSHIEIDDVTMEANGSGGMDAFSASTVVAFGDIVANNNGGAGLVANGKTFFEVRGAAITASQNQGNGVAIINDSRLQIFSFPEAQGSTITATDNGFAGIALLAGALSVVGEQFFGSGANVITATNNFLSGFFMSGGAIISPHATAKFVAEGNRIGMLMEDDSSALVVGGLNLSGNGAGISAFGAGTLTLVSVPPNPSTVNLNQVDLDLGFGTRVTADGVTATDIACDGTALLRGSLACP